MPDSPKKRFLTSGHAKRLADYVSDPAVIAGLDAALLQMSWEAGASKTAEIAAACHWQLTGAHRFRDIFLTIALAEKLPVRVRSDNLPNEV